MTTAAVAAPPEMRVVATIRALKASRRISTDAIMQRIGVSRSTWFDRMRSGQFTIGEIIALADLFGVTVQSLVDGEVTVAKVRPYLVAGHGITGPQRHRTARQSPLMHALPFPDLTTR